MDYEQARQKSLEFSRERDWEQFHNPKDLAISLSLEAAELLEVFQWSGAETEVPAEKLANARDEIADVAVYCIYLADCLGFDLPQAISDKMDQNAQKYPVEKARGSAKKYTEL